MTDDNPSSYRVFISHAGHDSVIANLISLILRSAGVDCFLDIASLEGGERIKERINAEIENCNELLLFLTPHSIQSQYVWAEYGMAMALGKRVVVIYHELDLGEIFSEQGPGSLISDEFLLDIMQIDRYIDELSRRIQR